MLNPAASAPDGEEARSTVVPSRRLRPGTALRLALTVWLVYVLHFASNVVRETYLAIALGDSLSVRVDPYMGLHPDLFEIEGRGAFINNNPGASMLGAIPYLAARPLIAGLLHLKPDLAAPKPPATYDDPRPNRNAFMNEARARGMDVKLGLAAASMQVGLMAPLGAAAAVVVFLFLRARLRDERLALWLALLYAFGTPIFFRSAFLNQNAILAHMVLLAYVAAVGPRPRSRSEPIPPGRAAAAGFFLGVGVLCDYSAASLCVAFGGWIFYEAWRGEAPAKHALRAAGACVLGATGPVLALLAYQWAAFGNPLLPAQAYMPPTELSTLGWNGFVWTDPQLLVENLFDPRFGLFAFCPLLVAALFAPLLRNRPAGPATSELALIFAASAALYVFSSSVQFAYLQFNTGVRYMVPAVPLLFLAAVPVLLRLPRAALWVLLVPTIAISWSVSMAREAVGVSLGRVFLRGFELPWLTVLEKMASGYVPWLANGTSPLPIFVLAGVVLWLVWRNPGARSGAGPGG